MDMEPSSTQPVLRSSKCNKPSSQDGLELTWICTFSYRWQTCTIAIGLASLVTGTVFFLISVGMHSWMWKALGTGFTATGFVLAIVGGVWCGCVVSRDKKANPRGFYYTYSKSELEAETMTSEATCIANS